jgi:phage shock protein A
MSMPEETQEPDPTPAPVPGLTSEPDTGYTAAGVPTLEGVRDKIESRYGTALGATELAEETPEARSAAEQFEKREKAAADKLEEIRASMRKTD